MPWFGHEAADPLERAILVAYKVHIAVCEDVIYECTGPLGAESRRVVHAILP